MYHGVGLWTGRQGLSYSYRMLGVVRWMFATICHNKKKPPLYMSISSYLCGFRSPDRGNKAEILPPGAQWLSHNYIQRYIHSGNTALNNSRGVARVHTCLGGGAAVILEELRCLKWCARAKKRIPLVNVLETGSGPLWAKRPGLLHSFMHRITEI